MRPLPETRSRRQSGSNNSSAVSPKRHLNGFVKEPMTTRSKSQTRVRNSLKRKAKDVSLSSSRDESRRSSSADSTKSRSVSPKRHKILHANSLFEGLNNSKEPNNNEGRPHRTKNNNELLHSPKEKVQKNSTNNKYSRLRGASATQAAKKRAKMTRSSEIVNSSSKVNNNVDEGERLTQAQKAMKRRSELFVLNCEAEEFMFGETAAEKHEMELPPLSPAMKKRYSSRMRTNELGELLKETPFLGSKLRKHPDGSDNETSPTRKKPSAKLIRRVPFDDEDSRNSFLILSPFASPSISIPSPQVDTELLSHQSVRIQNIVNTMEWRYSFEEVPETEVWFQTFSRQEHVPPPMFSPCRPPVVLPYEIKNLQKRSPNRLSRFPRKSPRCHASTLAMLSSCTKSRTRSATSATTTPLASPSASSALNSPSTSQSTTRSAAASVNKSPPSALLNALTSPVGSYSKPPVVSLNPYLNNRNFEVTATQYLIDSIHYLSDPYVVQLLAGDSHKSNQSSAEGVKHITNNTPCCPIKNLSQRMEASERRASLRSESSSPNHKMVPSPKVSPRNCCTSTNSCLQNGGGPLNSHSRDRRSSGGISRRNAVVSQPKKSPIVLISDVKSESPSPTSKAKKNNNIYDDPLFFGEALPVPSWPV